MNDKIHKVLGIFLDAMRPFVGNHSIFRLDTHVP